MRHVTVVTATSSVGLIALFFVDAINLFYISMLGVTELAAAVGFAGTIQFFMVSLSIGFMIAGSATVSRAVGSGHEDDARSFATSAMISSFVLLGVFAAGLWVWRYEALALLGAEGEALEAAAHFLAIAVPSLPLIAIGMSCSGALRAIGEPGQAMLVTLGGGGVAAVLDPILIFGLDLGLTGAAWAMVLTRLTIAMIGLWLLVGRHRFLILPKIKRVRADLGPLLAIALPAMATQLSTPFGLAFLTVVVAAHGDSAVAGWAVVGRLTALAFAGILSLPAAVGPIIGQNYGAVLPERIVTAYRDAVIFATLYTLAAWGILVLATPSIISVFGLSGAGADIVRTFTTYGAPCFALNGALFSANAAFNNLGRPLWSTAFNWSRDALATPVLAFLFASSLGVTGAVWIQAMAGTLVGVIAGLVAWHTVSTISTEIRTKTSD